MKDDFYLTEKEFQDIKLIIIGFEKAYFDEDKIKPNILGYFPRHVEAVRNYLSQHKSNISQWSSGSGENYLQCIHVLIDILRILNQNPGSIQRCLREYGVLVTEKPVSSWFRAPETGQLYQETADRICNFLTTLEKADNVQKAYLEWVDAQLNQFNLEYSSDL